MARSITGSRCRVGCLWVRCVIAALVWLLLPGQAQTTPGPHTVAGGSVTINAFPLSHVDLMDDDFVASSSQNHEYLLMLDPDNLLFNFR